MRRLLVVWGVISLLGAACGTEDGSFETDTSVSGVLGPFTHQDCAPDEYDQLLDAVFLGRIAQSTTAFEGCISQINTGCSNDGSENPADYLAVARSSNPLVITCDNLGTDLGRTDPSYIYWLFHNNPEEIEIGIDHLATEAADRTRVLGSAEIANTIWHEVMHTHAFRHDGPGGIPNLCTEEPGTVTETTVPYRVGECIESAIQSLSFAGAPAPVQNVVLDEMQLANETLPSQVGPRIAHWMQGPRIAIRSSSGNWLVENGGTAASFAGTSAATEWRTHQPGTYCQAGPQTCNFVSTQPYNTPDFMIYAVLDTVPNELKCLQRGPSSTVVVATCDPTQSAQRWLLGSAPNGRYYLGDVLSPAVLGAFGTSAPQTARMTTTLSSGELDIKVRVGESVFVQTPGANECADVPLPSNGNGQAIQKYTCNNGLNQQWYFNNISVLITVQTFPHPIYRFAVGLQMRSNYAAGMCLSWDASGALQQKTCSGAAAAQVMDLRLQPDLSYEVRTAEPAKCVTRTAVNQWLQLQNCNGSAAQKWILPARR